MNDSLDLLCRKTLMSAYLYYHLNTQVWSDAEYDLASEKIAKYWFLVPVEYKVLFDPQMTNDPQTMRSTGFHFLFTERIAAAALAWWGSLNPGSPLPQRLIAQKHLTAKDLSRRVFQYRIQHA